MNNTDSIKTQKKVPELRFPGFSDEWRVKKLCELTDSKLTNGVFNDPQKVGHGFRLINVKEMYQSAPIDVKELTRVGIEKKEFIKNKVQNGDLFFTRSSLVKEGIAYSNIFIGNEDDITFDGHLIKLSPSRKHDYKFIYYLTKSSFCRRQLVSSGKTTTMTTIGQAEVGSVKIFIPSKEEQEQIAGFLTAVDERIELANEKLELMQKYKKGLMQQLFPSRDSQTPTLRFSAANGQTYPAWQPKKLGEISTIKTGNLNAEDADENAEYDFFDRSVVIKKYHEYTFDNEALIYAGEGSEFLPRYYKGKYGLHQRAYAIFNVKGSSVKYLYYYLSIQGNHFLKKAVGSTAKSLRMDSFNSLNVLLPCGEEQQKIADFLTAIDERIELQQQKLEDYKLFKKGLLQRMFV